MNELSRGAKKILAQARRASGDTHAGEPDQIIIQVPGGQSLPPIAPARPNVTQNIVFVVSPQTPAPPATAPMPQEVHYHHTTNNYQPGKRRRLKRGTSFFGTLSIVFALLAWVTAYSPQLIEYTKPIAESGMALGAFGLLLAILFRHVGKGVPFTGVMISAATLAVWLSKTGQLQNQYDQLRTKSPVALPAIDFKQNNFGISPPAGNASVPLSPPPAPDRVASTPIVITPVTPTSATPHRAVDHSIFGDGTGSWQSPSNGISSDGSPLSSTANVTGVPSIDRSTAIANLETARTAAARRLGIDYASAKSAEASAMSAYDLAKISNSLGSAELIDAHVKELNAASTLRDLQTRLDADPAVASAEQALQSTRK